MKTSLSKYLLFAFLFSFLFSFSPILYADSSGPLSPVTEAENTTSGGTVAWGSYTQAKASDDVRDTCSISGLDCDNFASYYLYVSNFGFAIPTGATIDGIKVEVECRGTGNFGFRAQDFSLRLFKAGTATGSDKGTGALLPSTEQYVTYGGTTDKWGTTWADTDINNSGFGFGFSITNGCCDCDPQVNVSGIVDHIRITVYYTPGGRRRVHSISSLSQTREVRICKR